jgi:hypothetical protein
VNILLDVPNMFSYHPSVTEPAFAGSPAREDTMSASKFLTEFLGFAGLITSLYGWTLVGHVMGYWALDFGGPPVKIEIKQENCAMSFWMPQAGSDNSGLKTAALLWFCGLDLHER